MLANSVEWNGNRNSAYAHGNCSVSLAHWVLLRFFAEAQAAKVENEHMFEECFSVFVTLCEYWSGTALENRNNSKCVSSMSSANKIRYSNDSSVAVCSSDGTGQMHLQPHHQFNIKCFFFHVNWFFCVCEFRNNEYAVAKWLKQLSNSNISIDTMAKMIWTVIIVMEFFRLTFGFVFFLTSRNLHNY